LPEKEFVIDLAMEKEINLSITLKELLHPRVIEYCIPLFNDGYFRQAAYESFVHIEDALKQKLPYYEDKFTRGLISFAYKDKKYKLKIPFGDDLQKKAHDYFDAVFCYYRNFVAHEPKQIDSNSCIRILLIASELLDMIDASIMPFKGLETVDDLVKKGLFKDRNDFFYVLNYLVGQYFVDEVYDGFFEEKALKGISDEQYETMFDFGLLQMKCEKGTDIDWQGIETEVDFDTFELTPEGAFLISEWEKSIK